MISKDLHKKKKLNKYNKFNTECNKELSCRHKISYTGRLVSYTCPIGIFDEIYIAQTEILY